MGIDGRCSRYQFATSFNRYDTLRPDDFQPIYQVHKHGLFSQMSKVLEISPFQLPTPAFQAGYFLNSSDQL